MKRYKGSTGREKGRLYLTFILEKTVNTAKIKQIAFIGAVALGAVMLLNTLAKRSTLAAQAKSKVDNGL